MWIDFSVYMLGYACIAGVCVVMGQVIWTHVKMYLVVSCHVPDDGVKVSRTIRSMSTYMQGSI
jgi:hypothetical protein